MCVLVNGRGVVFVGLLEDGKKKKKIENVMGVERMGCRLFGVWVVVSSSRVVVLVEGG